MDMCKLQAILNKIVFILNLPSRCHIGQAELDATDYLHVQDQVTQLRMDHVFKIKNVLYCTGITFNFMVKFQAFVTYC